MRSQTSVGAAGIARGDSTVTQWPGGMGAESGCIPARREVREEEIERRAIVMTLRKTQGNVKETAAVPGIDRCTLYEKLKRYDIPQPHGAAS